ncbi:AraC family transcriptional regulator [Granulicella mallensis]|uniref:AraC family transcriptional regulator n=2 Tax=Granulicella mallensis TaxID=940614 RepID=A0A7W7ZW11_9BACT|nr:AraC family transcriptional regulator [Granulicella mallensis]
MSSTSIRADVLRFKIEPSREPERKFHSSQVLVQILEPVSLRYGTRLSSLTTYDYSAGEIVLCPRHTEKWVMGSTPGRLLMVTIPDQALVHAAGEYAHGDISLDATERLEDPRVGQLVRMLSEEEQGIFQADRLFTESVTQALAALLIRTRGTSRNFQPVPSGGLAPAQLRRVVDYMRAHLDRELSLAELAEEAKLSPPYFGQMFLRSTGQTPHRFLLGLRIDRAKEMLRAPWVRMMDVSLACGFKTQQHFSRTFRIFCSLSPRAYRNQVLN